MKHIYKYRLLRSAQVLLVSALLLFAQQVALHHQVGHILDGTALQSQQSANEQALHSSFCDFHETFASVLGVVGTDTQMPALARLAAEQRITYVAHLAPSEIVVPASRGPPISLLS